MDVWTIGDADRLRFPRFPSQLGNREMLAFAHTPTGTTASTKIDHEEVRGKITEPVGAPAIRADIDADLRIDG